MRVRNWVWLVAVVLFVFLLGAPAMAKKDVLIIGQGAEPVALDPPDITDNPSEEVVHHIYEGLVKFNENMKIVPQLATKWWVSEDGLKWTFKLRKGVKFHSGAEFDANAVKKHFDRILNGKLKRTSLYKPVIKEVKVVDKYTVEFDLKVPFGAFLNLLAHTAGKIVDPTYIEKGINLKRKPSGTGPFKFKEWEPGDHITLVANDNYWGGKPKLKGIVFKTIPEDTTRTMMLETGELDVAERVSPFDLPRLKKNKDLVVDIAPSLRVIYIGMNCQKGPTADVLVRRAFNYAVDRKAICKNILKGMGTPNISPLSPYTNGYVKVDVTYDYDPKKAKELLEKAGWKDTDGDGIVDKDGKPLELELRTPHGRYLMDYKIAEAVQAYLEKIGVKVKLRTMDWGAYLASLRKPLDKTDVQMFLLGWAPSTADADWVLRPLFHSSNWAPNGPNRAFYKNPEADKYIELGMSTVDPQKRREAYKKALEIIISDAPWIFLHTQNNVTGYQKYVKGLVVLPLELTYAMNAYIEEK